MKWIPIKEKEADAWNEQLKKTNASFFQYPYYAAGYRHFLFSKPVYLRLEDANNVVGFCCIMQIGFWFLKLGLVIRGPVFFKQTDIKEAVNALKEFAQKQQYILLRI